MSAPRWSRALLRWIAPPGREDEVAGDLEEAHQARVRRRGRLVANVQTGLEALDMAGVLLRERIGRRHGARNPDGPKQGSLPKPPTGLGFSWLDFKLGFRMLIKYPGLTVVAGLAMAFAIMVGAASRELNTDLIHPKLPLDEGNRIVEIRNQDVSTGFTDPRALHDFVAWRDELRSIQEMGAYQTFRRNLITEQGRATSLFGADMTATALGIARVPPLLGRPLVEADEVSGAPNVLVIGYDVWQSLFGSAPDVVGRTVRLGSEPTTIVGVMPEGFGWPRSHDLWAPLRLNVLDFERGESPAIQVVARLAPGVTLDEAQTELTAVGLRTSADHPETHEHLRPEVVRYGSLPFYFSGFEGLRLLNVLMFAGLMLLVSANVALLLLARTAARESEIVVRSALGASRGRIVTQLFAEALVLGGVAALVGLWGARVALGRIVDVLSQVGEGLGQIQEGLFGFWFDDGLSSGTVAYAIIFTILAAVVAGVLPALKVTGHCVHQHLQRVSAGGSGLEFGRKWTAVIVIQIALTVAFVPLAIALGIEVAQVKEIEYGFPAEEYLSVEFATDREFYSLADLIRNDSRDRYNTQYEASFTELKRRVAEEPSVAAVTVAGQIPGAIHTRRWIEVEGATAAPPTVRGHRAQTTSVDLDFFDVLGTPIISGRGFDAADLESDQDVVVVNEEFARLILEDRNPIGRRLAFVDQRVEDPRAPENLDPWYRIVGVVKQIAMSPPSPERPDDAAGVYQLLGPTDAYPVHMAVHVGRDPGSFAARLRELGTEVDPALQLHQIRPLDESAWVVELLYGSYFWVLLAEGGIALLLSTAGIFSIMAFTVSRRTREIGVRVALGADRRRVVTTVFSRTLKQIGLGVGAGGVLLLFLMALLRFSDLEYRPEAIHAAFVAAYLAVMLAVCMLACTVPMRRALGIEPTEALRADG